MKHATEKKQVGRKPQKRNVLPYEPSTPVAQMIRLATMKKPRGALKELLEKAVANSLGATYPKLMERWLELQQAKRTVRNA